MKNAESRRGNAWVGKLNKINDLSILLNPMRFRRRKKSYIDEEPPQTIDVDNLVNDTTRRERFQVFEVLASVRRYLVGLLVISGALSTILSLQLAMNTQMLLSPIGPLLLIIVGFIGVANIICGLFLLASE